MVGASGLVFAGGAGENGNGQQGKADAAGAPGANADVLVSENALRLTLIARFMSTNSRACTGTARRRGQLRLAGAYFPLVQISIGVIILIL